MSRIGKLPVKIPGGVKVKLDKGVVTVTGPKGALTHQLPAGLGLEIGSDLLSVKVGSVELNNLHGLTRTVINNMVVGVSVGFSRELEIVGVGYRAQSKGSVLSLSLGYSHPIDFVAPEGISLRVDGNTKVVVSGADKALVGLVAAKVRSFREPEPYQGKGVKYSDEVIVRKQGKAAGSK